MKVLITGANGFIGSSLAKKLVNQKHTVRCFVHSSSNIRWLTDLKAELFYGNLFDKVSLKNALKDVDIVYHLAGATKVVNTSDYNRINYIGTKTLIDTIVENKIKLRRFLFVSSQAAYGPANSLEPITENRFPKPLTLYGKSKLKAQQYIESFTDRIPFTIIIPSSVYGPRETDLLDFFKTTKMGIIPKLGGSDKYLSLVHVNDLTDGMIEAGKSDVANGKKYFLTNPIPYSWSEIARVTLNYFGKGAVRVNIPLPLMNCVAAATELFSKITKKQKILSRQKVIEIKQDFWICSPAQAKNDFGWEAKIDLEEGIKETLGWYVAKGWL
ncbi:MAG: NAD-dependent epimerase/dehydratase family protein [Calditrichaeota bacterium]|nr:MAG: NAD-dependent epimerase/dehydratase family protein [Calditrichota bacterium]MBL1206750.1 NAD-dependent epimerase/dehydratase family protein [Calditrichota bacterium]NOG46576.1 NAD-dependent epimerase/dehydratase family protein [Calditrichota bacterium]